PGIFYKRDMALARKSITNLILLAFLIVSSAFAQEHHTNGEEQEEEYNPTEVIMHHIRDSHEFHIFGDISLGLPVILWTDNGLVTFISSEFQHDDAGQVIVERKGMKFARYHDEIYYAGSDGKLEFDDNHHPVADRPLNFSITKNVFTLFLAAAIMLLVFIPVANSYKRVRGAPKGLAGFIEPLILFVRNDIAIPNIGKKKYEKYMPYLL